jgi:hypothetical protein
MRIILNIGSGGRALPVLLALLLPALSSAVDSPSSAAGAAAASPRARVETSFEPGSPAEAGPEHGKAFTGDATPIEPGHVEVELAYAPTWWATAGSVDRPEGQQHQLGAAVGVGIVRDVDLRLAVSWAIVHEATATPGAPSHGSGPTDTTLAARWRFLRLEEPAVDLAVSAAITMPTGTRATAEHLGTGGESWSGAVAVAASADWGRLTAGLELGFSTPLGPPLANDVGLLVCNAAVGYQAMPWLQPELELNYQHEIETGEQRDEQVLWATAAVILPLDPVRVVVGARIPVLALHAVAGPMATASLKLAF